MLHEDFGTKLHPESGVGWTRVYKHLQKHINFILRLTNNEMRAFAGCFTASFSGSIKNIIWIAVLGIYVSKVLVCFVDC